MSLTVDIQRTELKRIKALPRVTIGTDSTKILSKNPGRTNATLYADAGNTEGVFFVCENGGTAALNNGPPLVANGIYKIESDHWWGGEVFGICASGGMIIHTEETE